LNIAPGYSWEIFIGQVALTPLFIDNGGLKEKVFLISKRRES
jgi:hypothetical protein